MGAHLSIDLGRLDGLLLETGRWWW